MCTKTGLLVGVQMVLARPLDEPETTRQPAMNTTEFPYQVSNDKSNFQYVLLSSYLYM